MRKRKIHSRSSLQALWFGLSFLIVIIDQITKWLVMHYIAYNETVKVFTGFDLTLRHNTGAAFNFLADESGWQRWFFVTLATVISLVVVVWMRRLTVHDKQEGYALALILGGAIGNLIDRALYGHVIDFILWYYKDWQYPAFNIADSAICVGVALFVLSMFKRNTHDT